MDRIFYNGIIHTMAGGTAGAVAVQNGRIAVVGGDDEILKQALPETELIDLGGQCLLPGFNDSHCHFMATGLGIGRLNLKGAASTGEIIARGRKFIEERHIPEGQWVVGEGFDHNLFETPALPDKTVAEAISKTHPILLERVCGHAGTVNDLALRMAGFTPGTVIAGGVLAKSADGDLNGVLCEAALDFLKSRIPKVGVEEAMRVIQAVSSHANTLGVTSVQTDDLEVISLESLLEAYSRLEQQGKLTVRVFEEVQAARIPELSEFLNKNMRTGWGSDFFKIGNIKLLTDGSLGARTAFLRRDYSDDPGNRGVSVYTQPELDEVVGLAHDSGMQIAFHAIGDGAVERCVNAVEKAVGARSRSLRHRIVHCQVCDDGLLERMKALEIGADIQPAFAVSDRCMAGARLGPERSCDCCRWKGMLEKGVLAAGSSDSPVESLDPLWGIYCAVTRESEQGIPRGGWHPEQRITVEQAVAMYTANGAYMSFEEDMKGTVETGKLADFVVLSGDIFSVEPAEILKLRVTMTVVGGRICYRA